MTVQKLIAYTCISVFVVNCFSGCGSNTGASAPAEATVNASNEVTTNIKKLNCFHVTQEEFFISVNTARTYESKGIIKAGVIPHHMVGAALISGFFKMAAENATDYDTVIIVSPNHEGDIGDIVLSSLDWNVGNGVTCDAEIIEALLDTSSDGASIVESNQRMEDDHSSSVLIPYIHHYLPDTEVAPILVSRTLTLEDTMSFANSLIKIINDLDRRVLLVCSIDFSHYLSPEAAAQKDEETIRSVLTNSYEKIHAYPNEYLDSPATLIVFMKYLSSLGITPNFIDHTDASEFLGLGVPETTSYFVIAGFESIIE